MLTFQAGAGVHPGLHGLHGLQVTVPQRVGIAVVGRGNYWVDEQRDVR